MKFCFLLVALLVVGLPCIAQDQKDANASSTPPPRVPATKAQTTKPGKEKETQNDAEAARKQQILDLLERSHAANEEVLPDQRVTLLARQISMVTRLNPESGEKWAQELFQLGDDQADEQKRGRIQAMTIQMVAPGDPEFGLKLLHQMKPVSPGSDPGTLMAVDPLSGAATAVFQSLVREKGESQIPRLRQEALRLAAESQYPYSAMAGVAMEAFRESRHDATPSDGPGVMEEIFDDGVTNYERSTATWTGNSDFARMVQRMAYQLPREKVKHALGVFVNNAQATTPPAGVLLKVDYGAGSTQINDPLEIALFHYVSLLREFDPDLLKQLSESHPHLAQAAVGSGNVRWMYGDSSASGTAQDANQITRLRAQGMASWNPDNALALTQGITDPEMRAVTMGSVAEQVASNEPSRAMQLLDQAQKTAGNSQDLKTQLQLAASRADVAEATKNSAMLRDALRQGFEVGDQLLRQEQDNNQGQVSWYMLGSLVQTGIKADPDLTLAYINSFSLPYVRAELLLDAAQALRFNRRIAHSFRSSSVVN